jgi:hypothetical protein
VEPDVGDDIESVDFIKEDIKQRLNNEFLLTVHIPHIHLFLSYVQESKEDKSKADAEMETEDKQSGNIEKQPEGTEAEMDAEVEKVTPCPVRPS